MNMRTFSSSLTFFYKYIFTLVWVGFFGFGTISMFLSDSSSDAPKYQFLFTWIIGTLLVYLICGRLKKVQIEDRKVYISNYFQSTEIDISALKSVSGSIFLAPELVWFKVEPSSIFGQTIIFMPPLRIFCGFTQHPLVKELKDLCINDAS